MHYLLVDFLTSCNNYSNLILRNNNIISIQLNDDIIFKIPTLSTLDYLAELNLADLIDAYVLGKNIELKTKCISLIYESVKKVQNMEKYRDNFIKDVIQNFQTYQNQYRKHLQDIIAMHDDLAFNLIINHLSFNQNSLENDLLKIFIDQKHLEIVNKNSIFNTYKYIVQPLESLIDKYKTHPNILNIQKLLIPCKQSYLNLENFFKVVQEELKHYARVTKKVSIKTKISLSILEEKKKIDNVYSYSKKIINSLP